MLVIVSRRVWFQHVLKDFDLVMCQRLELAKGHLLCVVMSTGTFSVFWPCPTTDPSPTYAVQAQRSSGGAACFLTAYKCLQLPQVSGVFQAAQGRYSVSNGLCGVTGIATAFANVSEGPATLLCR
jgi:hypothetical protein